ncbi:ribonuclease kappa-A-like [Denticeps clupeoides]|uniref:Uncharacterized protein n=1 Tax=Denticeps clupeoides TaxID=299321 RepID=A0AAY4BZY4_9TELE|nr:ribonuclease kappa-A-like [Denticeps clupeoides]
MALLFCGPKLAACGMVLSVWGVIMLVLLGIFFSVHSAVLIEDVPLTEADMADLQNPLQNVYARFNQVGYNCFIAAGVYVVVGLLSVCQAQMNKRRQFLVD